MFKRQSDAIEMQSTDKTPLLRGNLRDVDLVQQRQRDALVLKISAHLKKLQQSWVSYDQLFIQRLELCKQLETNYPELTPRAMLLVSERYRDNFFQHRQQLIQQDRMLEDAYKNLTEQRVALLHYIYHQLTVLASESFTVALELFNAIQPNQPRNAVLDLPMRATREYHVFYEALLICTKKLNGMCKKNDSLLENRKQIEQHLNQINIRLSRDIAALNSALVQIHDEEVATEITQKIRELHLNQIAMIDARQNPPLAMLFGAQKIEEPSEVDIDLSVMPHIVAPEYCDQVSAMQLRENDAKWRQQKDKQFAGLLKNIELAKKLATTRELVCKKLPIIEEQIKLIASWNFNAVRTALKRSLPNNKQLLDVDIESFGNVKEKMQNVIKKHVILDLRFRFYFESLIICKLNLCVTPPQSQEHQDYLLNYRQIVDYFNRLAKKYDGLIQIWKALMLKFMSRSSLTELTEFSTDAVKVRTEQQSRLKMDCKKIVDSYLCNTPNRLFSIWAKEINYFPFEDIKVEQRPILFNK